MQVKIVTDPANTSELYQEADVVVLPIFINSRTYADIRFDPEWRRKVVGSYLKSRSVSFLRFPDNLAAMFIATKGKHSKRKILKAAGRLYMASVKEDFAEFDPLLRGVKAVFVTPANAEPSSIFVNFASSKRALSISTSDDVMDKVFRAKIRSGALDRYTPERLAHPTVRAAFERDLVAIADAAGYELMIDSIINHKQKALVTCEAFPKDEEEIV